MRLLPRPLPRAAAVLAAAALVVPPVGVVTAGAATAAPASVPAAPVPAAPVAAAGTAVGLPTAAKTVVRYTSARVNVRSGPGTTYRVVGSYSKGGKLKGTVVNGWLRTGKGKHVSLKVLSTKAPSKSAAKAPAKGALTGSKILAQAARYRGIMYRAGGSTTSGFDCSGYTKYVFAKLGRSLPRTVSGQKAATTRVSTPRAGDLVFWGNYHVAIYAGNNQIWDSGRPGLPVQKRRMFSGVTSFGRVG